MHYSDNTLSRLGTLLGTMCASTLPVLAIVALYCIQSMGARLAAIAVFTSMFSALLGLFSNSRSIEIFAATAGFVYRYISDGMRLMNVQIRGSSGRVRWDDIR